MSSIAKSISNAHGSVYQAEAVQGLSLSLRYDRFIEGLKFSHFSVITMAILIGSCWGGVVAMYVFMAKMPMWAFGIGLFASLANLVACISQAPTKWVVNLFTLSMVVNLALLVAALLLLA